MKTNPLTQAEIERGLELCEKATAAFIEFSRWPMLVTYEANSELTVATNSMLQFGHESRSLLPRALEDLKAKNALLEKVKGTLEEIGGLDCDVAPARHGKPCGKCVTCLARQALRQIEEVRG